MHLSDPTINSFIINTNHNGDFSHVLNLFNFEPNKISDNEIPFISEVVEILCNKSIVLSNSNQIELTIDNVTSQLKYHDKYPVFYTSQIQNEIDFVSSHSYEICTKEKEDETEDQLLNQTRNILLFTAVSFSRT